MHYWNGSNWVEASAANAGTASLLAIAVTDDASDGMCIRGIVQTGDTLTAGAAAYINPTAGRIGPTAPSTSGQAVRIVGYALSTEELYFNPSPDWITLA